MNRRGRIVVTLAVAGAIVAPVVLDRDDFPLSTYPMYSRARGDEVTFATAHAVSASGSTETLTLAVIGDSDDPLVVAGELRSAIRAGDAEDRCVEIAQRAAVWDGLSDEAVAVEVATERHDVVARANGDDSLVERTVHARCAIGAS
jgi:hypothetical protein